MTIENINIDLSENTLVLTFDCIAVEKNYAIQCYVDGDVVYYIKAHRDGKYEFLGTKRLPVEIKELVPSKEKAEKMFITNNGELPKKLNLFLIENMLGVTPEFISYLKEEFEKNEPANHEILICCRICDDLKDTMNLPEEFRDEYFNDYPLIQIGVRCWKNNTAKDVLFTGMTTADYLKTAVIDNNTIPGKEWIKQLIDEYGEIKWPDEKGHSKYFKKIMKNETIYNVNWSPNFEWKNGRIVEGPDIRCVCNPNINNKDGLYFNKGRVKWESIWEGLTKILKQKNV